MIHLAIVFLSREKKNFSSQREDKYAQVKRRLYAKTVVNK